MQENDSFNGFSIHTLQFLSELALNNSRPWFDAHKDSFVRYLLDPMRGLVIDIAPTMIDIDPDFETAPEVDRTISRIYRDIRFSKDKSPYRSNMWITFKRRNPDWKDAPAYFFELMPDWYRYGMGYYSPSTETMAKFREAIASKSADFMKVAAPLEGEFELAGEDYKQRKDAPSDPLLRKWFVKKNFYLTRDSDVDDLLFSHDLVPALERGFKLLAPLYWFLMGLQGAKRPR
jgi:uncharacterized protein (TIGR02453 family)